MGCDIHPAVEVQDHDDAYSWLLVARPDRTRNYEFFSLLAGVRGEYDAWVLPRGYPEKCDLRTYYTYNDETQGIVDGDHTPSWFTLAEARAFVMPKSAHEWTQNQWNRWLQTMEFFAALYAVAPERVRAVFNFDS